MKTEFDQLQTDFAWSHHICEYYTGLKAESVWQSVLGCSISVVAAGCWTCNSGGMVKLMGLYTQNVSTWLLVQCKIYFKQSVLIWYFSKSVWQIQKITHDLSFRHLVWWFDRKWSGPLRFQRSLVLLTFLGFTVGFSSRSYTWSKNMGCILHFLKLYPRQRLFFL